MEKIIYALLWDYSQNGRRKGGRNIPSAYMRIGRPTGEGLILYLRIDSPAMAFATNDWISSGVSAAGLNAAIEGAATVDSSVTICGGRVVFIGGDMNTG